jgi:hypothetical protein
MPEIETIVYRLDELSDSAKEKAHAWYRDSPALQDMTVMPMALCDLARWLYRQLKREYDDLTSNEAAVEAIATSGYTVTETGRRFR